MSETSGVNFSSGLPSTVLPAEDPEIATRLAEARLMEAPEEAVAAVVADHPRSSSAWATLGDVSTGTMARYAAYRVGYHRGLDALRAAGWRGSGYVRWSEPTNTGFLRCLSGLADCAGLIGEDDEAERCQMFLLQLDPAGRPS